MSKKPDGNNSSVKIIAVQLLYGFATLYAFKADTLLGWVVAVVGFFAVLHVAGYKIYDKQLPGEDEENK